MTRETKLKGWVTWKFKGHMFREKKKEGGKKKSRYWREFFQAYGKCRSDVDLQHGRRCRRQMQVCKAFSGKRCHSTEQIWLPNSRLLQWVMSTLKNLNDMASGSDTESTPAPFVVLLQGNKQCNSPSDCWSSMIIATGMKAPCVISTIMVGLILSNGGKGKRADRGAKGAANCWISVETLTMLSS